MNSLRFKLLAGILFVILISQIISAIVIWHESLEHIEIMLNTDLSDSNRTSKVNHELKEIILSIILITVISASITIFLVYSLIMQITQPLENLIKKLKMNHIGTFEPIDIDTPPGEITLIKTTINQSFTQIKHRFEQERRFTSDVAHELRTPLAGLRLHLELKAEKDPSLYRLIQRIDDMTKSIELLFKLARTEELINLGKLPQIDLVSKLIEPLKEEFKDIIHFPMEWTYPEHCEFKVDEGLLAIAIRNLLLNMIKHAGNSQQGFFSMYWQEDCVVIEIIDTGSGMTEAQLEQINNYLYATDLYNPKGWGVGLSLVARIIKAHNGKVEYINRNNLLGGLTARLTIPKFSTVPGSYK